MYQCQPRRSPGRRTPPAAIVALRAALTDALLAAGRKFDVIIATAGVMACPKGATSDGFELAKRALAWYLVTVPTYSLVYGAFATVPILLLWIYLVWVIVLLALNHLLWVRGLRRHTAVGG